MFWLRVSELLRFLWYLAYMLLPLPADPSSPHREAGEFDESWGPDESSNANKSGLSSSHLWQLIDPSAHSCMVLGETWERYTLKPPEHTQHTSTDISSNGLRNKLFMSTLEQYQKVPWYHGLFQVLWKYHDFLIVYNGILLSNQEYIIKFKVNYLTLK